MQAAGGGLGFSLMRRADLRLPCPDLSLRRNDPLESPQHRRWRRAATFSVLVGIVVSAELAMTAIEDRDAGLAVLALVAAYWSLPQAVRRMRRTDSRP